MLDDPYAKSRHTRFSFELEFRIFKEKSAVAFKDLIKDIPKFKEWSQFQSFYLMTTSPETVQFSFSQRPMGRLDLEGKPAIEKGLSLVYSIGPNAAVDIQLYPLKSTLASVSETMIHLDLGYFTAHELMQRLKSDLSDLVTYGYVTSLDAEATLKQKARIWFLRNIKAKQIEGKFEQAPFKAVAFGGLATLGSLIFRGFLASFFKPVALVILFLIAVYFNWDSLRVLLSSK